MLIDIRFGSNRSPSERGGKGQEEGAADDG